MNIFNDDFSNLQIADLDLFNVEVMQNSDRTSLPETGASCCSCCESCCCSIAIV